LLKVAKCQRWFWHWVSWDWGAAGCRTSSLSPVAFAKRCKVSALVLILSKWRLGCGSLPHFLPKPGRFCQKVQSVSSGFDIEQMEVGVRQAAALYP